MQILGDQHGNLVHLYERDCSVQRRHQKVVEVAPASDLDRDASASDSATPRCGSRRQSATTTPAPSSSSSTSTRNEFFFIEVNPRIQVEHTVTEEVTGIDLVRAQILIAAGPSRCTSPEIGLPPQDEVPRNGFAIQCRVTTEDPENNFMPDYGRILTYRSAGGFGIRLDGGIGLRAARSSRRSTIRCW